MAKTKAKAEPITSVTLQYDLFELPTAQHKAGLAGLVLQLRSMEERAKKGGPPVLDAVPSLEAITTTSATITFAEKTVQGLFDDLYAAEVVEVAVKSKWPGKPPKDEREVEEPDADGKLRKVKRFIYDVTQPCGHFLRGPLQDKDVWLKLWRAMLWAIPRGNPQTRKPFEECAGGKPCGEGRVVWKELVKVEEARRKHEFYTTEVAGSLWLGAHALNAEAIPFEGRAEQNLLLHFWPLTTQIFVSQQIDSDGLGDFLGYVLAIPEVSDLKNFVIDYPLMLSQLGKDMRAYYPTEAVIHLPAQGALAFLEHLARLAQQKAEKQQVRYSVGSIEYLHLAKIGNNIKTMAAGRIAPRPNLLEHYQAIVGCPGQPPRFRNPLFRRALMLSLLDDREWYEPMASILADWPAPFFVVGEKTPRNLPWFFLDARQKFQDLFEEHQGNLEVYQAMAAVDPTAPRALSETPPSLLVHHMVRTYLNEKAEAKSGIDLEKFKEGGKINWEKVPAAFGETKRKLAESIFLEFRSRRDQAFIDRFVGTFCSAKQYLTEREFCVVADHLMQRTDDVKTLTLLALSANS